MLSRANKTSDRRTNVLRLFSITAGVAFRGVAWRDIDIETLIVFRFLSPRNATQRAALMEIRLYTADINEQ